VYLKNVESILQRLSFDDCDLFEIFQCHSPSSIIFSRSPSFLAFLCLSAFHPFFLSYYFFFSLFFSFSLSLFFSFSFSLSFFLSFLFLIFFPFLSFFFDPSFFSFLPTNHTFASGSHEIEFHFLLTKNFFSSSHEYIGISFTYDNSIKKVIIKPYQCFSLFVYLYFTILSIYMYILLISKKKTSLLFYFLKKTNFLLVCVVSTISSDLSVANFQVDYFTTKQKLFFGSTGSYV